MPAEASAVHHLIDADLVGAQRLEQVIEPFKGADAYVAHNCAFERSFLDLDKIAAERQRMNARLVETGKLIHLSEAQLSVVASRVGELEAKERSMSREKRHETLAAALQKMAEAR